MHNQKWDISDAQSSTDLHGCLVLDAVASTLDARASTADGLDAAASTHGLDAWPRRLDASGAWSHSTPPLDTSTLARRYSLDVCSTLGSTQARRLDARAQSASPSAGRSTAPQGDPLGCDGAACRRSALKGRRRGALGRVDGVCAPAALKRTVVALSARMESIASGGILGSLLGAVSRLWGPGVLPACRPNLRRPQVWSVCGAHALWLCP